MRTHTASHTDSPNGVDTGLRDLTSSLIRFTNAVTLFSMQQMQNAVGAVTDSQAVINSFCNALDAISNTLSTQIDASKKSTLDSMSKTGSEMVDRTMDAMNVDTREIMDTTTDVMRKTSDSVADIVRRATNTGKHGHHNDSSAGEP